MRNLFFALLLANLAFAAWQAWFAPAPPGRSIDDGEGERIRLVDEVDGSRAGNADGEADGADARGADTETTDTETTDTETTDTETTDTETTGAETIGAETTDAGSSEADDDAAGPDSPARSARDGASTISAAAAGPAGPRCVSVGPFQDLSDAATASAKLRAAGYRATQRVGQGEIWVGYWVHIDGIPTREEANAALATLHENGVTEAYRIPGEETGDMISLGVFTEVSRAGRLRDRVRALGLAPTVVDRTRRGTVYWVDVRLGAGEDLGLETLQAPGRITRLEQRTCGSAGI